MFWYFGRWIEKSTAKYALLCVCVCVFNENTIHFLFFFSYSKSNPGVCRNKWKTRSCAKGEFERKKNWKKKKKKTVKHIFNSTINRLIGGYPQYLWAMFEITNRKDLKSKHNLSGSILFFERIYTMPMQMNMNAHKYTPVFLATLALLWKWMWIRIWM